MASTCAVVVRGTSAPTHRGDVHRLHGDLERLHVDLLARGPYDVIVDESATASAVARWRLLLFHVVPHGRLVFRLPSVADHPGARKRLLSLIGEVAAVRERGAEPPVIVRTDQRPRREQDLHALAASLVDLTVDGEDVIATRSDVSTLATVPEHRWDALLDARPALGALVESVPAIADAPTLALREFRGVVLAPRQIAYVSSSPPVVVPSTFRQPTPSRLRIRSLVDWSERSARAPTHVEPVPLPGVWFHLDNVMRGHFGHALTEQLSLVWAWERAKERHPDIKAIAFSWPDHPEAAWERELFAAAGVDDYVVLSAPVRVESLVTATPAYAIGTYVHPEIHATWARTGAALAARAAPGPRPARLFLSRGDGKRSSTDAAAIEALATSYGFTVVRPESYPLSTQAAMIRSADVVAGYAGSAMFNLALTAGAQRARGGPGGELSVVVVSSDTYPAHNEQQLCKALDLKLTMVRGRSLVREGLFVEVFHADYTLDEAGWEQLRNSFEALDRPAS